MLRLVIFGNSGSGKSTLAKKRAAEIGCVHLDLDTVAWDPACPMPTRMAIDDSRKLIDAFLDEHDEWVIEGCYADLIGLVLPRATEMIFLNPGIETCIANARRRPWEPHKYASKEEQDAKLEFLIGWIRDYESRDDEFSLKAHRRLFDGFAGAKREVPSDDL